MTGPRFARLSHSLHSVVRSKSDEADVYVPAVDLLFQRLLCPWQRNARFELPVGRQRLCFGAAAIFDLACRGIFPLE